MDNRYHSFIIKTETLEHEQVLIVGVAEEEDRMFQQELEKRFSLWQVPAEARTEPFLLDFYLAKELCRECPEHILVLGATIKIELSHGCSGGVLGDPFQEPRSVNAYTEELRGGLVLAGLPGGPGFVLQGTEEDALSLLKSLGEFDRSDGVRLLRGLAHTAQEMEIPFWLGVSDGSGYSQGAVGVVSDGEMEIVALE